MILRLPKLGLEAKEAGIPADFSVSKRVRQTGGFRNLGRGKWERSKARLCLKNN